MNLLRMHKLLPTRPNRCIRLNGNWPLNVLVISNINEHAHDRKHPHTIASIRTRSQAHTQIYCNHSCSFSIQMGKQTMGTPCQALKYRSDNKLYRIQVLHFLVLIYILNIKRILFGFRCKEYSTQKHPLFCFEFMPV